jgi:hypothetical protein
MAFEKSLDRFSRLIYLIMTSKIRTPFWAGIGISLVIVVAVAYGLAVFSDIHDAGGGTVTLRIGESGTVADVSLIPREVVEDSRCPIDVQCIQAGRVRVRVTLGSGMGTADQVFLVGEPITTEAESVTLTEVTPVKMSQKEIKDTDYRFTFKVVPQKITYQNASTDLIVVDTPPVGAVTGRQFRVTGKARGTWFFEASFPVKIVDPRGKTIFATPAEAQDDWMTEEFVPFIANITVPETFIGPATLVLEKDNPSGMKEKDASVSFPITISY